MEKHKTIQLIEAFEQVSGAMFGLVEHDWRNEPLDGLTKLFDIAVDTIIWGMKKAANCDLQLKFS